MRAEFFFHDNKLGISLYAGVFRVFHSKSLLENNIKHEKPKTDRKVDISGIIKLSRKYFSYEKLELDIGFTTGDYGVDAGVIGLSSALLGFLSPFINDFFALKSPLKINVHHSHKTIDISGSLVIKFSLWNIRKFYKLITKECMI